MKRFLGLSILIMGLSIPAHAQHIGGSTMNTGGIANSAGGGVGGGGISKPTFPTVLSYPRAVFASTAVSGTADFVPSTFLSFHDAIEEGKAELAAQHVSVAEAAEANLRARKTKARFALVEDANGNAVIARQ